MSYFLDDFQSNLDSLPHILQRKYSLLRDLDKSLQEIQRQSGQRCTNEIEQLKREIKSGNATPDASNIRFSDEAIDEPKHAVRIADEKVALAVQAYDLVDAHIQQLDQYLMKFNEELREKESISAVGSAAPNAQNDIKSGKVTESGRGGRKKSRLSTAATATTNDAASGNPTSMDLDLPVDPNEPTYCFCNQVSYGEMVGCDNTDCKIEWFHFGCVGVKEKPKGKWYCSDCATKKNKRKGR